jgi:hypothetical protein
MREATNIRIKRKRFGKEKMQFVLPKVGESIDLGDGDKFIVISASEVYSGAYLISLLHADFKIEMKVSKNG